MQNYLGFDMSKETWRMFRIISEFVEGFETLSSIGDGVTVFGSARTPEGDPVYERAVECGKLLVDKGLSVITGGGPGIMEAANKGAYEADGTSVGLNITLPMEQSANPYQTHELTFRYFFVRKVMFVKYARAFIIFPGGFGTMDEFFESMTLIQTLKIKPFPVVCVGVDFWGGLVEWMKETMLQKYKAICEEDLERFYVTDDVGEAVDLVSKCIDEKCWLGPQPEEMPDFEANPTGEGTITGVEPQIRDGAAGGRRVGRQMLRRHPHVHEDEKE